MDELTAGDLLLKQLDGQFVNEVTSREYATDVELLLLRFVDDNIEVNKLEISTHKYGKNTFKLIKPGHPSKLTLT